MVVAASEQTDMRSRRLWADYRVAFRDWAMEVDRLRGLPAGAAGCSVVKEAEGRVDAAEVLYRDSRNRLTDDMNHACE